MNRLFSAIVTLAICSAPAFAQSGGNERPLQTPEVECNRVFHEARQLPSPNTRSIYDYGRRVVDQGGRCLESGFNEATRTSGGARRAQ